MANIELPKDAHGRVIPLDTETLYEKNGVAKLIYHYDYEPRGKAWFIETYGREAWCEEVTRLGRQL